MISLAKRGALWTDSYEVGYALSCILFLRNTAYCPAEPASSTMDIALLTTVFRRMD
jgi:hypothetical protein